MAVCGSCGYKVSGLAIECGRCHASIPVPSTPETAAIPVPAGRVESAPPAALPPAAALPPPPPPSSMLPPSSPDRPSTLLSPAPPPPPAADAAPEDRGHVSRGVIAIVAAAAVIVVAMIVVIAVGQSGPDEPAAGEQPVTATELAAGAEVEVPGTAPDGVDSGGNAVTYAAANLVDGDPETAWRVEGDASGEEIVLTLPAARTVTEVGIVNGYAKVDEESGDRRYGQNRRVLAATWLFDDGTEATYELEETVEAQTFTLDNPVETATVRVRIDEVSDPGGRDFTAISELSIAGSRSEAGADPQP